MHTFQKSFRHKACQLAEHAVPADRGAYCLQPPAHGQLNAVAQAMGT